MNNPVLVLASSSPYRKQLLSKLGLPFCTASANVDETPRTNESAENYVARLSLAKAQALKHDFPQSLIIGSDQSATLNGQRLHKPENQENAIKQLSLCSDNSVRFYTGLCLLNSETGRVQQCVDRIDVKFRNLTKTQIINYVEREQPLDCAGSFKVEGLGIALFSKLSGDDPNSLIGLPLIKLTTMLIEEGMNPLDQQD